MKPTFHVAINLLRLREGKHGLEAKCKLKQ